MKNFNGKVLFLDRSDINTDEIIPAKYLTESTREGLAPYLLEDLALPGFHPDTDIDGKTAIVTRSNFGCGSSREHAPWALETHGINIVIAESFARIFRRNMFNCGLMAVELSQTDIDTLFTTFSGKETTVTTDLKDGVLSVSADESTRSFTFAISDFDIALVQAGGWIQYAEKKY